LLGSRHGPAPKKVALTVKKPNLLAGNCPAFCDPKLASALKGKTQRPMDETLAAHLKRLKRGEYVAILAFINPDDSARLSLNRARSALRRLTKAPVLLEFGPRYLHSTGQLYKGGTSGLFILISDPTQPALPVPGKSFGFENLFLAQARGDFEAMLEAGRRILRLDLSAPGERPLDAFANALENLAKKIS
jgi:transaldolase/glucose-6-phosphate isomerase